MTTSSSASASDAGSGQSGSFERLDPRVQQWVYQEGWQSLRKIQEDAIPAVLDGETDLIIAAATAAGKTEAAFLPLCSLIAHSPGRSVRVLGISPLRALINDQASRLERLAESVNSQVTPWHGDIAASRKRRLLERPRGIVLITPESLEALFVLHGTRLASVFADLGHVVVDELHAFVGSERGRQLQSLMDRLELVLRRRVPRIALSATLGDVELAAEFLRPRDGASVRQIVSEADGRELQLQLRGYVDGGDDQNAEPRLHPIADHLFQTLRGGDHLVFTNRRTDVEALADLLRRRSEDVRVPNEFFPHHGSLSRELREDVERMLKDPSRPTTAVCTSTLELGIDIGSVVSIGQVGTLHSVAALRQRLGRSGRRPQDPSILRGYVTEPPLDADSPLQDRLRPQLVQAIAVVDLLIDGWCEPPPAHAMHLSTLVQQVLSLIAQHGGVRADQAWEALCKHGPFGDVSSPLFVTLLRDLAAHELIQQMTDGTLILGPAGELLADHYTFYAAFTTPAEYQLVTDTGPLGTLPISFPLAVDSYLIFGGRRWRVTALDEAIKTVHVEPAAGGRAPSFVGGPGLVHDAIRRRMRDVYLASDVPAYLDRTARAMLAEARAAFGSYGLDARWFARSGSDTLVFLWAGDRALATVLLHLRALGLAASHDGLAITIKERGTPEVWTALQTLLTDALELESLALLAEDNDREKYHHYLSDELLAADYASAILDLEAARRAVADLALPEATG